MSFFSRRLNPTEDKTVVEYGYEIINYQFPTEGLVQFASWQHPRFTPPTLEQSGVDELRQFINKGDFVIDIGAHCGDTSIPFALATGKTGCVMAVEANRYIYKLLEKNSELNREITNIKPHNIAATEEDAEMIFHYGDASFCNGGQKTFFQVLFKKRQYALKVQGRNLLNLLYNEYEEWLPKFTFIKTDVEGYDFEVLKTLEPLLRQYKPTIFSEVLYKLNKAKRYEYFDFLTNLGYEIRYGNNPHLGIRTPPLVKQDMLKRGNFDLLATSAALAKQAAA